MKRKQNFISGAIILGFSGVIAKFLGLFFRWPVTMLIGDEGIGIYQLSYPVYTFFIAIISGFPIAISGIISEKIAHNKRENINHVLKISLVLMVVLGFFLSALLIIIAPYLLKIFRWRYDSYYSIIATAIALFFVTLMGCYRGYFQGTQTMTISAIAQIIEQIGRVISGVLLTYLLLPYGIGYAAAGASFGACIGAVFGFIYLIIKYKSIDRHLNKGCINKATENKADIIKKLITIAFPISIGMTVSSIMSLIDSIIVPSRLLYAGFNEKIATLLYGQLTGKAHVLVNVPLTFAAGICVSLIPSLSEVKALKDTMEIKKRAEKALELSMYIAIPCAIGLFILADPILHLIFPGKSEGASILKILSISIIFIIPAQTLVAILQGVGDVKTPVKNIFKGAIVKLIMVYLLTGIPELNVRGAALSSIIGYFITMILNLKEANKVAYINLNCDKMLLRPVFSSVIMGIVVYFIYFKSFYLLNSNSLSVIFSIIIGVIMYIFMVILCGGMSIKEIKYIINILRRKE